MRSVLLLEGDTDSREAFAEYLGSVGFHVQPVASAHEAQARSSVPDAVVTCLHPQGSMDGLAFIRWLRGQLAWRHVPVIVVSASAFPADEHAARAAGCDAFLTKPCLPSDLACELRHVIADRRVPRPRPAKAVDPSQRGDPRNGTDDSH